MTTFEGYVITRTPRAILFWGHYWWAPLWLPLSQIQMDEDGQSHRVKVKPWLTNKKGLQEFCEFTSDQIEEINNG